MKVGVLYKLKRGNQNQSVGLIVNGLTASIAVYGSQVKPTSLDDMEDCTDSQLLDNGTWSFSMLPEYVYFTGTADRIDIVNMSFEALNVTFP